MHTNKEQFLSLLRSTNREGVENVIRDIEKLGFFEAPASSMFHLNEKGGLLQHSMNVCNTALALRDLMISKDDSLSAFLPVDSVIIASLLHDVCKSDIYILTTKKRKNALGLWTLAPGYDLDYSNFPMGHGEKSVIMLLRSGLKLTDDEMIAIRWHMHAWDLPFQSADIKGNLNAAKKKCPLAALIQAADGLSSSILERK